MFIIVDLNVIQNSTVIMISNSKSCTNENIMWIGMILE